MNVYIILLISYSVGSSTSVDANNSDLSNWMKKFQNDNLVDLPVIPGTHHSGILKPARLYDYIPWGWVRCQTMSLEDQLESGVRFLDFRVHVDAGDAILSHTFLSDTSLAQVIDVVTHFLRTHSTEGIIILLRADFHFGTLSPDAIDTLSGIISSSNLPILNVQEFDGELGRVRVSDLAGKVLIFTEEETLNTTIPYLPRSDLRYRDIWRADTISQAREWIDDYMSKPHEHHRNSFRGVALDGTFGIWQQRHTSPGMNKWFLENISTSWAGRADPKIGIVMLDFVTPEILEILLR